MRTRLTGITLVELIICFGILIVLMGMVAVLVGPAIASARTEPACATNLRQIAAAYQLYSGDNDGKLPPHSLFWRPFKTAKLSSRDLEAIGKCPMTQGPYWDDFEWGAARIGTRSLHDQLPNGAQIPTWDPDLDILYRCLDHAFDGYDRGVSVGRSSSKNTRGRVLGVRLDGTVAKVAPDSCWEFRYYPDEVLECCSNLWSVCDRPANSR